MRKLRFQELAFSFSNNTYHKQKGPQPSLQPFPSTTPMSTP
jgi:hypothetical protein